jgi:hypothetical protein
MFQQFAALVLMSNVEKLSQARTESIEQYIHRSRDLMAEAQDLKAVASAEQLCLKIVRGLLPHHKHAVGSTILAAASASAPTGRDRSIDESRETFESIISQIACHCELLEQQQAHSGDDDRAGKMYQAAGHSGVDQQKRKDTRICNHCQQVGHIRRTCPKYLAGEPPAPRQHRQHQPQQHPPSPRPHAAEQGPVQQNRPTESAMSDSQLIQLLVRRLQSALHTSPPRDPAPGTGQARVVCSCSNSQLR